MGNSCCGGGDFPEPRGGDGQERKRYAGGAAPAVNAMTPDEDERREQARKAAEERARQNAVRGTQRYKYVLAPSILIVAGLGMDG